MEQTSTTLTAESEDSSPPNQEAGTAGAVSHFNDSADIEVLADTEQASERRDQDPPRQGGFQDATSGEAWKQEQIDSKRSDEIAIQSSGF